MSSWGAVLGGEPPSVAAALWRTATAAVLTLPLAGGCAKRTDARARAAFEGGPGAGTSVAPEDRIVSSGGGGGAIERRVVGWPRVAKMIGEAIDVLQTAPRSEDLARLAERWCAVAPEPQATLRGEVFVCTPTPPLTADGQGFTLELGGEGVIGLVASNLSGDDADRLLTEAKRIAATHCDAPWNDPTQQDAEGTSSKSDQPRFDTCPARGGTLLAVGRLPERDGSEQWQVSVAVLAPG